MKGPIHVFSMLILLLAVSPHPAPARGSGVDADQATSAADRLRSWKKHVSLQSESPFRGMKWRAVGPKFAGGRVESIDSPGGHSPVIFAGFGSGNLWKTVNNGLTWTPVFEDGPAFAVGDVAISPSNPDIIWLGTGESLMARSSFAGMGVFRSEDGGATWMAMGLKDSHHIGRVAVHPEDPDTVYVAAIGHQYTWNDERGLFKTTDGGKTWEKILYVSEKAGVVDVVMDPSDPDVLFAAAWERDRKAWDNREAGPGTGVYKSTDAGGTWRLLENGLPSGPFLGRIGLDVSRTNPSIVYAVIDNQTPLPEDERKGRGGVAGGEVYRSADRGETWVKTNAAPLPGVGYSFGDIRISPENENVVYVCSTILLRSDDGGRTFHKISGKVVRLQAHNTRALHLDQHELWIDPHDPDRLILGNDGGVFLSNDRGGTWLHLNNIPAAEFYAVSVDDGEPYNIYGGTQDNEALFGPARELEDGFEDGWWTVWIDRWGGGDSYFTLVDPVDPDIVYYEQQFGDFKRKNRKTGETAAIRPRAGKDEPPLRYNWMSPFIISRHNPLTLYFGANRLFKSVDRGGRWAAISPDLTSEPGPDRQGDVPYGTITAIGESPFEPGLIYVGTDDGRLHITRDDGGQWTRIGQDLPAKWFSRVVASRHRVGTVYVALTGYREDDFAGYLYRSSDFGRTWVSIGSGLPAESVNVVREDPLRPELLYAGTDLGVYVTTDGGEAWHFLGGGLPTTPVHDIAIQEREGELVIGTHGRSAFVLDISPIQNFTADVARKDAHFFEIEPAVLPQRRDYPGDWVFETRKKARLYFSLREAARAEIVISDAKGASVKESAFFCERGINEFVWDLVTRPEDPSFLGLDRGVELAGPGSYTVTVRAGKNMLEGRLDVLPPPSSPRRGGPPTP